MEKPIASTYKLRKSPGQRIKSFIKHKLGWLGKPVLLPYIGFGNAEVVYLRGRVVEDKEIEKSRSSSNWDNLKAMISRYISEEYPYVKIKIEFNGQSVETISNQYGEFEASMTLFAPLEAKTWHTATYTITDESFYEFGTVIARGEVMISLSESKFGIISDIDDTILISHSTSLVKKLRLMLLKNAATRLPFEGVAAFYRALHSGPDQEGLNPIFYVSSSEWNLYDLLVDFCKHQNIPKGTFLLHDLKVGLVKLLKSGRGKHDHKLKKIRHVLTVFDNLKFILIGDSGQKDPEIYKTIIEEFPDRILAVYIRDVSKKKRHLEVRDIAEHIKEKYDIDMLMVKDTEVSALHAIDHGYIAGETLIDIARERYKDQYSQTSLVQMLTGIETD